MTDEPHPPLVSRLAPETEPTPPGAGACPRNDDKPLPNDFLTLRVREAFAADRALQNAAIGIETFTGIVQLSGQVRQRYQYMRATEIARAVPGICGVRNCLEVTGPPL